MKRDEIALNPTRTRFSEIEDATFSDFKVIVMLRLLDILFIHYPPHLMHKDGKCINEVRLF